MYFCGDIKGTGILIWISSISKAKKPITAINRKRLCEISDKMARSFVWFIFALCISLVASESIQLDRLLRDIQPIIGDIGILARSISIAFFRDITDIRNEAPDNEIPIGLSANITPNGIKILIVEALIIQEDPSEKSRLSFEVLRALQELISQIRAQILPQQTTPAGSISSTTTAPELV